MNLKTLLILGLFIFTFGPLQSQTKKILLFSKTAGYRHASIKDGIIAIKKLGSENNFEVLATEDAGYFSKDSLKQYNAVLFLNTTGDILNREQEKSFEEYIHNGGNFIGIHAASDTEYDWAWYGKLVGAYFLSHPDQQEAIINIVDKRHPATKELPNTWRHFDEWYNFKNISPKIKILATLDENSYSGGVNGKKHPIAWFQDFEGGHMFYTALGHTEADYTDPLFLKHILGGIISVLN